MRQGVVSAPNGKSALWHQVSFPRISQWPALHTETAQGPAASLPGGAFPIHMGTSCESSAPSCPPNLVHVSWMLLPPPNSLRHASFQSPGILGIYLIYLVTIICSAILAHRKAVVIGGILFAVLFATSHKLGSSG